jgi:hypothetical protein
VIEPPPVHRSNPAYLPPFDRVDRFRQRLRVAGRHTVRVTVSVDAMD